MKLARHQITFEGIRDQQALLRAKIGIGNREIARITGLTDNQINYRLAKAKRMEEKDEGYRVAWRHGNNPLVDRILRDYSKIMIKEIERKIVARIIHPTPKVITIND